MPKRPCARPGCAALVVRGYCDACKPKHSARARSEELRESAHKRGYGRRWSATSKGRLKRYPLCADPFGVHGERVEPATLTDHIDAAKGDMKKFWDPKNWQSLCWSCHSRKTVEEDGGFGRGEKV